MVKIPPKQELTDLAKRYGHGEGEMKDTKKSGFTPVSPLPPGGAAMTAEKWEIRKAIEDYQRYYMGGFTARELRDMGAYAYFESPQIGNLQNPLHPVFSLDRWVNTKFQYRHVAKFPLGKGREGYWEAHNPVIWKVLEPCLRLATLFIDNFHIWPWWDTLCFGNIVPIIANQAGPGAARLHSIHPRNPALVMKDRQLTRDKFLALAKNVTWALAHGSTEPDSGLLFREDGIEWMGLTTKHDLYRNVRCYFDIRIISPLLRDDLKTGERLLSEFLVAVTAIHELAHAMWNVNNRYSGMLPEPYYENEVISELGSSLSNYVLNGSLVDIHDFGLIKVRDTPVLGFHMVPWPAHFNWVEDPPVLGLVESMKHFDTYPVPIEYFERIQQADFWNHHIQVFGATALHMGPLIYGRRRSLDRKSITELDVWVNVQIIPIQSNFSDEDLAAVRIENRKRTKARVVSKALVATIKAEEIQEKLQSSVTGALLTSVERLSVDPRKQTPSPPPEDLNMGNFDNGDSGKEEVNDPVEPARFKEIVHFLFNDENRRKLALDSMKFTIAEANLLHYINGLGVIRITEEEFRDFLVYCDFKDILFHWEPYGIGEVRRIRNGWPYLTWRPKPLVLQPPEEHVELMDRHMKKYCWRYTHKGLRDLDEDLVLDFLNRSMNSNLDVGDFMMLIAWCDHHEWWWRRGPPGILRVIVDEDTIEWEKSQEKKKEKDKKQLHQPQTWKRARELKKQDKVSKKRVQPSAKMSNELKKIGEIVKRQQEANLPTEKNSEEWDAMDIS